SRHVHRTGGSLSASSEVTVWISSLLRRSARTALWHARQRSSPRHAVPRQNLAHRFDQPILRYRKLRLGLLAQIVVALLGKSCELGAYDQIFDLDFALLLFVRTLDDDTGAAAAIGIFHLRAESAGAEIKFGPDAGLTQNRNHALIIGDAVLIEYCDDHGTGL